MNNTITIKHDGKGYFIAYKSSYSSFDQYIQSNRANVKYWKTVDGAKQWLASQDNFKGCPIVVA